MQCRYMRKMFQDSRVIVCTESVGEVVMGAWSMTRKLAGQHLAFPSWMMSFRGLHKAQSAGTF